MAKPWLLAAALRRAAAGDRGHWARFDGDLAALGAAGLPALFLYAERDRLVPGAEVRAFAARYPGATLVAFESPHVQLAGNKGQR